jgi:hypothetical protein
MNKALATLLLLLSVMICSISAQVQEEPNISFRARVLSDTYNITSNYTSGPAVSYIVSLQSAIWVPVVLVVVLFFTLQAMMNMDANKEQDTILYAKFLANVN